MTMVHGRPSTDSTLIHNFDKGFRFFKICTNSADLER